jgi:hypothetical protein
LQVAAVLGLDAGITQEAAADGSAAVPLAGIREAATSALADSESAIDLSDVVLVALAGGADVDALLTTLQRGEIGVAGQSGTGAPVSLSATFAITGSALADSGGAITTALVQQLETASRNDAAAAIVFARHEDISPAGVVFFLIPAHRIFVVPV